MISNEDNSLIPDNEELLLYQEHDEGYWVDDKVSNMARELHRLRTIVPLAERLVLDINGTSVLPTRACDHLDMELQRYKKDFQG